MGINVTGINHVIVAVEDLEAGIETFGKTWGLSLDHLGEAPELGIKAAYFNVGDAILELVTPYDDSEGNFVRKHIERRGEGLYMFCVRVDDMAAAIADLRAKGCHRHRPHRQRRGAGGVRQPPQRARRPHAAAAAPEVAASSPPAPLSPGRPAPSRRSAPSGRSPAPCAARPASRRGPPSAGRRAAPRD